MDGSRDAFSGTEDIAVCARSDRTDGLEMTVVMTSLMLVCAVLASLALGVLVAYGICQAMFRVFRVHSMAAEKSRVQAADVRVASQG